VVVQMQELIVCCEMQVLTLVAEPQ
jgi:hypothetical protein